jgi:hypothetical protein
MKLTVLLGIVLAFEMIFIGCENGTTNPGSNDGIVSKQTISSKWEIKNADSRYSSHCCPV